MGLPDRRLPQAVVPVERGGNSGRRRGILPSCAGALGRVGPNDQARIPDDAAGAVPQGPRDGRRRRIRSERPGRRARRPAKSRDADRKNLCRPQARGTRCRDAVSPRHERFDRRTVVRNLRSDGRRTGPARHRRDQGYVGHHGDRPRRNRRRLRRLLRDVLRQSPRRLCFRADQHWRVGRRRSTVGPLLFLPLHLEDRRQFRGVCSRCR